MRNKHITKMLYGGVSYNPSYLATNIFSQGYYPGVNYSLLLKQDWAPTLASNTLGTGLLTNNSSNTEVALRGQQLLSLVKTPTQNLTGSTSINPIDWQSAMSVLSSAASLLPGLSGQTLGSLGNAGTSVYKYSSNLKNLKGLTGQLAGLSRASNISGIVGAASDLVGGFLPEKDEYSGQKGDITLTADSVYDNISNAAMLLGPIGMIVGGAMKGGAMIGKALNAIGGGTDAMTTTDAILGSSLLNLTPFGLINSFGGSTTNTFTKDDLAFETVGSSYTGSNQTVNDALQKSGKKYGLFSLRARNRANDEILEARRLLEIISDIADFTLDRLAAQNSMAAISGNRRAFNMLGGYNQSSVRVGKCGLKINPEKAKQIIQSTKRNPETTTKALFLIGGKVEDAFQIYLQTLPKNQRDSSNYRVREYWEFNGKPKNFEEAKSKGMFLFDDNDGYWHALSVAKNPYTGDLEFMKSSSHPSHQMEVDWYNSDDASDFRNEYDLVKSEPYWKYVKREGKRYLEGGILRKTCSEIIPIILEEVLEFLQGGSINVIPDGALHARKHNMNIDGITPKGIPVISEENGKLELLAEVEKEEIIFRLEVTKKLEELYEKFYDENSFLNVKNNVSLEAGKLLTTEILHNTIDNTKSLL